MTKNLSPTCVSNPGSHALGGRGAPGSAFHAERVTSYWQLAVLRFVLIALFALLALRPALPAQAADGVVAPAASVPRGLYYGPLNVELHTITPGAFILYTLDGTPPTLGTGTFYTGPIAVTTTTVLSAMAFLPDGSLPASPVVTYSYIYPMDVVQQRGVPPGYPDKWKLYLDGTTTSYPADYDMDPEIVSDPAYADLMLKALTDIPSVSLVLDKDALFGSDDGIYQYALAEGPEWERPVSAELIYPDGRPGFQINAGIRIIGGDSRYAHKSPKHSFRLLFKEIYGPTKLEFPLFAGDQSPVEPTDQFDTLVLRAGYNNTWIHRTGSQRAAAQYVHDRWVRETQLAMGQPSGHGLYVHLYINGLYWGLYDLHERPSAPFMASYLGGEKEEYDVLNSGEAVDGDTLAWQQMMGYVIGGLADPVAYQTVQYYLDVENLADYMILNHFAGNVDWDRKNWYAGRKRVPVAGYKFFSWDAEKTLGAVSEDVVNQLMPNSPTEIFHALTENEEFRTLFADRVYYHTRSGGALDPGVAGQRYQQLSDLIFDAVIAESARWGDYRRDVHEFENGPYELYTRNNQWLTERQRLLESYFPHRTEEAVDKYDDREFFPDTLPPGITPAGGAATVGMRVRLTNPNIDDGVPEGDIWYTLDGTDPRPPYNAGAPLGSYGGSSTVISITASTRVQARVLHNGEWSAMNAVEFFTPSGNLSELRLSEVMYNPWNGEEHEFVELWNAGESELDVGGVRLTDGITYTLPAGTRLAPGARAVIAENPDAFAERYGFAPFNDTGYRGRLGNGGDSIVLRNAQGSELLRVHFAVDLPTQVLAAGVGYSLVPRSPGGSADVEPDGWRVSANWSGSPGGADPQPAAIAPVVVNEVLATATDPADRYVELYNPNASVVDIGGWYLSNSLHQFTRYRIPDGTQLMGYGYAVFSEADVGFALDPTADGDDESDGIYLLSADAAGTVTGYGYGFGMGSVAVDTAVGRCYVPVSSDGGATVDAIVRTRTPTRAEANARPQVGPVVFSELMYHPQTDAEFVELVNLSAEAVPLYDPLHPANTWRIQGIGEFYLPAGTQIPAGGVLLVVPTDPAAFRNSANPGASAVVVGPYSGKLSNAGERIALERPGTPRPNGTVPYLEVDALTYGDDEPWPESADGDGASLERIAPDQFGDSWWNWRASADDGGTPGRVESAVRAAGTPHDARSVRIHLPLVFDQRLGPQMNGCFAEIPLRK